MLHISSKAARISGTWAASRSGASAGSSGFRCRRQFSRSACEMSTASAAVKEFVVIGGGLMGSGIAQVGAQTGHRVTLVDVDQEVLNKAEAMISGSVKKVAKKTFKDKPAEEAEAFVSSTMSRIRMSTDLAAAVPSADLVIEAVTENLQLKRKIFGVCAAAAKPDAILASNTSSLRISDIAEALPEDRRSRFGGLHFFNPVPVMKLLEVVRIPATSDETFGAMLEFGKAMGKTTVSCGDTPGFVVNRLVVPLVMEAIRMTERGDATAEDVDTAVKLGAGHPMGLIELADFVGLDTLKFIIDGWHQQYPEVEIFKPSETLNKLVAEGKLGRKTGEGFYKY